MGAPGFFVIMAMFVLPFCSLQAGGGGRRGQELRSGLTHGDTSKGDARGGGRILHPPLSRQADTIEQHSLVRQHSQDSWRSRAHCVGRRHAYPWSFFFVSGLFSGPFVVSFLVSSFFIPAPFTLVSWHPRLREREREREREGGRERETLTVLAFCLPGELGWVCIRCALGVH